MNNALKEIAAKYEVAEESIPEILSGMKVKDPQKPTKPQLEGFEKACTLIQQGQPLPEAVNAVIAEAMEKKTPKETEKEATPDNTDQPIVPDHLPNQVEQFVQEQGGKMAEMSLATLPAMAEAEHQRLKEMFIQAYRKRIAEMLQDPAYRQRFETLMLGGELGKSMLSSSTTSNIALPSSSSTSS
jgi:hypothetical protein